MRRHYMTTLSALLSLCEGNPPVIGGFPSQRDSNVELWCFGVFWSQQAVELTAQLSWFETPWRPCDAIIMHYKHVIMSAMASQITSPMIVYSTVYSGTDERKHQSSASLAFVRGIHRWPVNSPHKGPVTRKKFPFDDVIMDYFRNLRPSYQWRRRPWVDCWRLCRNIGTALWHWSFWSAWSQWSVVTARSALL